MFRKLVSNLPFSPALVGQLGFYARRLKKEEITRRLGLIMTALALVVQSFAVFSPPESANASNPSDMIRGGVSSVRQVLDTYDRSANGNGDFKQIMDYAGVTRTELAAMQAKTLNSKSKGTSDGAWKTWGRVHRFSSSQGEVSHIVPLASGKTSTVYSRPLWLYDSTSYTIPHGSSYKVFMGHSAKLGDFAIMEGCGNLISTTTPKPAPQGAFVQATCTTVSGQAFDLRNRNQNVKVYLYFSGPPGKGTKYGPITTAGQNGSFSYSVPESYRTSSKPTQVWGVLVPLSGWNEGTVQFKNTVTIPGGCVKAPVASATCVSLQHKLIERTKFSLTAKASALNGAKVTSYEFTVKDKTGKVVDHRVVNSSALQADSGTITLANNGDYTATVTVHTSAGDKTGGNCATTLTVAPQEMCTLNPALPKNSPDCKPCAENPEIWYKDDRCNPTTVQSKEAKNLTQNAEADTVTAQASDRIEYTIYVENVGEVPATAKLDEELSDVAEYATLQDNGGGIYNSETKVLSWGAVTLKPGEKISRSFTVQLLDTIPNTPRGNSEPGSYDCVMTNAFGNTITINVKCDTPKAVEGAMTELPKTGPGENLLFAGILAALVTYFWARARQTNKEVRLIRKEFNMGTI